MDIRLFTLHHLVAILLLSTPSSNAPTLTPSYAIVWEHLPLWKRHSKALGSSFDSLLTAQGPTSICRPKMGIPLFT
ncbi:hypothetical protein BKA70DRAFT_1256480 [Coprinopsis sp. MPI-PUGE-AT-0042]|nr:hypothetical protein BKA70DRAFT_1256480 [Coprinopsis sp. MPI-PUGE-AT-0042]